MADRPATIEVAIDTAGSMAGLAISQRGATLLEMSWRTHNNHSAELLPALEYLLERSGFEREQIAVIFINRGPGSYAGLRVGISTAMGLALALGTDLLSVGRLELDACAQAAWGGPVCALHQAGRGDIAWAVYQAEGERLCERQPPTLSRLEDLVAQGPREAVYCGELDGIGDRLMAEIRGCRLATPAQSLRRASTLAELAWGRYAAGARDNPLVLEPLYLREPNITQPREQAASPAQGRTGCEPRSRENTER